MLHSVKDFQGYRISAKDGGIGRVYDFYFDDERWNVRYLIVDTGNWLPGRRVLLSPIATDEPDPVSRRLPVELTQDQIRHAPSVGEDEPISRQMQIKLHEYYGWPAFGGGGAATRTHVKPGIEERTGDPNLRSMREVIGYHIQALDGEIGHVEDFIIDDETWIIRYVVINTRNWLPGKSVLVSPLGVEAISWGEKKVHVDLTRERIKNAPAYDPTSPVARDYEEELYDFYGWPKYWT